MDENPVQVCETCGAKATVYIRDYVNGIIVVDGREWVSRIPHGPSHFYCNDHARPAKQIVPQGTVQQETVTT